jgi:hypothetical protein
MKFKRIAPGVYHSLDSRFTITRQISKQTYHPDEICWQLLDNGKWVSDANDTLAEAKEMVEQIIKKESEARVTV